jgi:hypothetical protein
MLLPVCIKRITTPGPVFQKRQKTSFYGAHAHVLQLFKFLFLTPIIEIVELELPDPSLRIDVPEWQYPAVSVAQQRKRERVGHPPSRKNNKPCGLSVVVELTAGAWICGDIDNGAVNINPEGMTP